MTEERGHGEASLQLTCKQNSRHFSQMTGRSLAAAQSECPRSPAASGRCRMGACTSGRSQERRPRSSPRSLAGLPALPVCRRPGCWSEQRFGGAAKSCPGRVPGVRPKRLLDRRGQDQGGRQVLPPSVLQGSVCVASAAVECTATKSAGETGMCTTICSAPCDQAHEHPALASLAVWAR